MNQVAQTHQFLNQQFVNLQTARRVKNQSVVVVGAGKLEGATSDEILACLRRQKILSAKQQFRERATEIMRKFPSPLGALQGRIQHKTRVDPEIRRVVEEAFAGREDAAAKVEEAINVIADRVGAILSDPERWKESKMAEKIVAEL